ncbi:hypothetical protein KAX01_01430 [Candidatus Bathyarchaeota archaeon]|nr:hypothetical protein [Candidatus Bathyarchaeota archaeon]
MVVMTKLGFHPNAYLSRKRNVKRGLISRSKILRVLEGDGCNAQTIAQESQLNYHVVLYHLRLLEVEGIVIRKNRRPFHWKATSSGQQRLKL